MVNVFKKKPITNHACNSFKYSLNIFFLFFSFCGYTQHVLFEWAAATEGNIVTSSNTSDASGNIYEIGEFTGTIDFNPGSAVFNLSTNGDWDIFVRKLDANGNFVWAKSIGSNMLDRGKSICIDASGDLLMTGIFRGIVDFDPGNPIFNLISYGFSSSDIFILKISSGGNFIWAKSVGGIADDMSNGITTDISGNVYVTGMFQDSADFDPGMANNFLISGGKNDAYIVKFDDNGGFVWAGSVGGTSEDQGNSITTDPSGNVYITGFYEGTADFDPGSASFFMNSAGLMDVFVLKLNTNGSFEWSKSMGGTSGDEGLSITSDQSGNVYITGYFEGTADFDPGTTILNLISIGSSDIFIQKFNGDGSLMWIKNIGGMLQEKGYCIASDIYNNFYVTGFFSGNVDFDPGSEILELTSQGSSDMFILSMDSDGEFLWANQIGGFGSETGNHINTGTTGNIFTSGKFTGIVDFDPTADTFNLSSGSGFGAFIQKLSQPSVGIEQQNLFSQVSFFPNPNYGIVNIRLGDSLMETSLCIKDINGQIIFYKKNIEETFYQFDFHRPAGLYIIELSSGGNVRQFKLIKM